MRAQKNALPHLQSIVIVLLKVILSNITALTPQTSGQNSLPCPLLFLGESDGRMPKRNLNLVQNMHSAVHAQHGNSQNENAPNGEDCDGADPALAELNLVRLREITSKAITSIFLMLLKWFKLSCEFLTTSRVTTKYRKINIYRHP